MQSSFARGIATATMAAACVFAFDVAAQTLYKLIDKNGKVTYSEKAPKDFDGKVIRMDIDPNANTATLGKPSGAASRNSEGAAPSNERTFKRSTEGDDRVAEARINLEGARKAFADARDNPSPGDVDLIGKKGGGARQQPTEEYQRRLEKLEQAVKEAENALQKAEQAR